MFSRKQFLAIGLMATAAFTTFRWGIFRKHKKAERIKFLTRDGKLVEVEINKLPLGKRVASKEDIQDWVKI